MSYPWAKARGASWPAADRSHPMCERRTRIVLGALAGAVVLIALAAALRARVGPTAHPELPVGEQERRPTSTLRLSQAPFNPLAPGWSPLE